MTRSKRPDFGPLAVVAILAAIAGSAGAGDDGPVDLLFATTYHGDEINAGDGDTYLAMVRVGIGDGWMLTPTPIRVNRVEDPILDMPGEKTGKEVRVDGAEPLFLVRGGLAPGPVETLIAQGATLFGSPRFELELANGSRYRLTVDCPDAPEPSPEATARGDYPEAWKEPCPLRLHRDAHLQQLASLRVNRLHETGAHLLWAGDLDRDGRLDLLIDLSNHYNVSAPTLFLSAAAAVGELVAPVARLVTYGC